MNDLLSRVYRGSMGLVQMSGIWCYRIDVKDKQGFVWGNLYTWIVLEKSMTLIVQRLNEWIMLGLVAWHNEGHEFFE